MIVKILFNKKTMDSLTSETLENLPESTKKRRIGLVFLILSIFIVFLLFIISAMGYQNKQLRASNRELIWNLTKTSEVMRVGVPNDEEEISQEESSKTEVSLVCPSGFTFFENEYMSFCYPDRFTLQNSDQSVLFSSDRGEQILVGQNFSGGFGGGCIETENFMINAESAMRTTTKETAPSTDATLPFECTESVRSFTTIVNLDTTDRSDVWLSLQKTEDAQSTLTLDFYEYQTIEQSIQLK